MHFFRRNRSSKSFASSKHLRPVQLLQRRTRISRKLWVFVLAGHGLLVKILITVLVTVQLGPHRPRVKAYIIKGASARAYFRQTPGQWKHNDITAGMTSRNRRTKVQNNCTVNYLRFDIEAGRTSKLLLAVNICYCEKLHTRRRAQIRYEIFCLKYIFFPGWEIFLEGRL